MHGRMALLGIFCFFVTISHGLALPTVEATTFASMDLQVHNHANSTPSTEFEYPAPFWVTVNQNDNSSRLLTPRQEPEDPLNPRCHRIWKVHCETSAASPRVEDVAQGAEWFRNFSPGRRCTQHNHNVQSKFCTTMDLGKDIHKMVAPVSTKGNRAKFSLCDWDLTVTPRKWIPCIFVAKTADVLIEHCAVNGKVGGIVMLGTPENCMWYGLDIRVSYSENPASGP